MEIVEGFKSCDTAENPKGESLPVQQHLYCINACSKYIASSFLLAGVPLNKLPLFIELLEEYAYNLQIVGICHT